MTYVQAVEATDRNDGHIKIHDPATAFAGMRAAGRLAAECLDMLVPEVRDGVTT
jgi:methionyl aminopeptidase